MKLGALLHAVIGPSESRRIPWLPQLAYRMTWLSCACLLSHAPALADESTIAGTWEVSISRIDSTQSWRLTIVQAGSSYGGTLGPWRLAGQRGSPILIECEAAVPCGSITLQSAGDSIVGEGTVKTVHVTLRGQRPVVRPYATPRTINFDPRSFSGVFATLSPVLKIFPGDTVRTRTLDAEGFDEHNVKRSGFINPQTGPFYVENAMPGDTLAIHFVRIRTNRTTADMYGDALMPNALDPSSITSIPTRSATGGGWTIDSTRGVARLSHPSNRLESFEVPLAPMLGCVGVAPPSNQTIRTVNLGSYGGNLDYSGVHEGATLYLPVFQRGALLFIGDGHARQGDGELTGTGLETSMEVEMQVDLIKDQTLGQPRIEDADYEMISGIGGSLSDALQSATSGMVKWIEQTYRLDARDIAMILGSSMHYDITEIVDPQVHVVAKIRRAELARIRPERRGP